MDEVGLSHSLPDEKSGELKQLLKCNSLNTDENKFKVK
jgi:hypothetical protein